MCCNEYMCNSQISMLGGFGSYRLDLYFCRTELQTVALVLIKQGMMEHQMEMRTHGVEDVENVQIADRYQTTEIPG